MKIPSRPHRYQQEQGAIYRMGLELRVPCYFSLLSQHKRVASPDL